MKAKEEDKNERKMIREMKRMKIEDENEEKGERVDKETKRRIQSQVSAASFLRAKKTR